MLRSITVCQTREAPCSPSPPPLSVCPTSLGASVAQPSAPSPPRPGPAAPEGKPAADTTTCRVGDRRSSDCPAIRRRRHHPDTPPEYPRPSTLAARPRPRSRHGRHRHPTGGAGQRRVSGAVADLRHEGDGRRCLFESVGVPLPLGRRCAIDRLGLTLHSVVQHHGFESTCFAQSRDPADRLPQRHGAQEQHYHHRARRIRRPGQRRRL